MRGGAAFGVRRDPLRGARAATPGVHPHRGVTIALGVGANTISACSCRADRAIAVQHRATRLAIVLAVQTRDAPRRVGSIDASGALRDRARTLSHVTARGFVLVSVVGDPEGHQRERLGDGEHVSMLGVRLFRPLISPGRAGWQRHSSDHRPGADTSGDPARSPHVDVRGNRSARARPFPATVIGVAPLISTSLDDDTNSDADGHYSFRQTLDAR